MLVIATGPQPQIECGQPNCVTEMRALPLLFQEYEPRTLREVVKLEILTQVCWYRVEGLGLWSNPLRGFFGWGAVGDRRDD